MKPQLPLCWLDVEPIGKTMVIRFTRRDPLDEETGYALGKYWLSLVEAGQQTQIVIDFGMVSYLDSLIIGKLFTMQKRIKDVNGRLVLCGVNAELQELLDLVRLSSLIPICPDEDTALQSLETAKPVLSGPPHFAPLRKRAAAVPSRALAKRGSR